jgi:hypothetical protein
MSDVEYNKAWCRSMMRMLSMGGVWGVPRSGLIFTKTAEDTLKLTGRAPGLGSIDAVLQSKDLLEIRSQFEAAGFKVEIS